MLKKTFSFLVAGLTALLASSSLQTAPAQLSLDTPLVANGLARPVFVTAPVGDFSRIFIVEQRSGSTGRIRIFDFATNSLLATPYLSVSPVLTGNEEGLLGLAFHPNFASNGYFFVYYTASTGNNVVVRYQATAPYATSTTADAASATPVLTLSHPTNTNHNGGWIGFGPDNYLYIGTGDGGSANDPPNNAQNLNSLLGKMLRLDVDGDDFPSDATRNYRIPPTNPFAGATAGADEIFHYGLRNPWRNSFDRLTGDLWIGDVGQNVIEEVDIAPAGLGGLNFGWRCMEGAACTALTGCTCNAPTLTLPVYTANHSAGNCSITGGYRYRGSALCNFQGLYFVTDFCTSQIFTFGWNGSAITNLTNRTTDLDPPGTLAIGSISSFGEDFPAVEIADVDLSRGVFA
ncbi:MAG: PQQ-dependent sugar dehydrogenase, partial [Planctomycetia bacterium]